MIKIHFLKGSAVLAESIASFLNEYLSKEIVVFIISLLPILELRGGMIAATLLGVPWANAMIICYIGNILPIPFILIFLKRVLHFMIERGLLKKLALKIHSVGETRVGEFVKKYPNKMLLGLYIFVAIPLPGTGGWTGALIAVLMDMQIKKSVPAIGAGIITAGIIMSIITYVIPTIMGIK